MATRRQLVARVYTDGLVVSQLPRSKYIQPHVWTAIVNATMHSRFITMPAFAWEKGAWLGVIWVEASEVVAIVDEVLIGGSGYCWCRVDV